MEPPPPFPFSEINSSFYATILNSENVKQLYRYYIEVKIISVHVIKSKICSKLHIYSPHEINLFELYTNQTNVFIG